LKDAFLNCHYVSAFDLSDAALDQALATIEKHRIRHLWGYPGAIYHLALRAAEKGWNQPLTAAVTWGDSLYSHYRSAIESAFHTRVFDTYGCSEGFQVAAQCGTGSAYHIHALDVAVELVDDNGVSVDPGQSGHAVITRLHPGPMPLLRYAVGDDCVRGETALCPCGRGFPILAGILGRDTDVIITPEGNRVIVHFFTGILEHFEEIECFQVVQQDLESIQLKIVVAPPHRMTSELERRIQGSLLHRGLRDLQINIEEVPEIPVARSGKRRFVISKIAPRLTDANSRVQPVSIH
jgi:phenylacetate-CoA ligase